MIINRKILLLPLITLFILSGLFLVPDIAEGSPCGWAPDYLQPGGLASGQCCNGWSQSTIPATYHTWCCGSGTGDTNCGNCSPTARSTCTPPPCGSLNTCSSCWGDNCRACPTDQVDITISWNENRDKDTIYTPCGSIDFSGSVVTDACSNDPLSLHLSFYVETAAAEGEKANRFTFFCGGDTFGNAFEITNCILPGDIVENPQIRMDYNWTFTWWQKSTGICTGTQTYVPNPPVYHTITAESECADNVIGNYALGETFPRPRPYPYYYCGTGSSLVGWGPPSLPDVGGATVDWHCKGTPAACTTVSTCTATRLADTTGVCGTAGNTPPVMYPSGGPDTFYDDGGLCQSGIPIGSDGYQVSSQTLPAEEGSSITWHCDSASGGNPSGDCTAIRGSTSYIDGVCGGADGRTFLYTDTSYSPYTQCSAGYSDDTAFPDPGATVDWHCVGSGPGHTDASCSANRASIVQCGSVATSGEGSNLVLPSPDPTPPGGFHELWPYTGGTTSWSPSMLCTAGWPNIDLYEITTPLTLDAAEGSTVHWWCDTTPTSTTWVKCFATRAMSTPGVCGGANRNYTAFEAWPNGYDYCNPSSQIVYPTSGTLHPYTPPNPTSTTPSTWRCKGSNGEFSGTCIATRSAVPVDGTCGPAAPPPLNTKTYLPSDIAYAGALCGDGNGIATPVLPSTNTTFPAAGSSTTWTCGGSNGGSSSPTCTATRGSTTDGICGTDSLKQFNFVSDIHNLCLVGTASNIFDVLNRANGPLGSWRWDCYGPNSSSTSDDQYCSAAQSSSCGTADGIPSVSAPTINLCTTGTILESARNMHGHWEWTCTGSDAVIRSKPPFDGDTPHGNLALCTAPILTVENGACGGAATSGTPAPASPHPLYPYTGVAGGTDLPEIPYNLCSSLATAIPPTPNLPTAGGSSVPWTCPGTGTGTTSATCTATRAVAPGTCGTANGITFLYTDMGYGTSSQCADGCKRCHPGETIDSPLSNPVNPDIPGFPIPGGSATWNCCTTGGCQNDCQATRAAIPEPGVCSNPLVYKICESGTLGSFTEYADSWVWWCMGTGGSTTNVRCVLPKIPGVCGTAARAYTFSETFPGSHTYCSAGTASAVSPVGGPVAGGSATWTCAGINYTSGDHTGDVTCTATRTVAVINGACSSTTAQTWPVGSSTFGTSPVFCTSGTATPTTPAFPSAGSTPVAYQTTWTCVGSGTGHTDATCIAKLAVPGVCNVNVTSPPAYTSTPLEAFPRSGGALCSTGTASSVSPVGGPTPSTPATWTCAGLNGGGTTDCTATRTAALTATCSVAPTFGTTPLLVTWTAVPSGGSGTYSSYLWAGTDGLSGNTISVQKTYTSMTPTPKTATVKVIDSAGNTFGPVACSNKVDMLPGECGAASNGTAGRTYPTGETFDNSDSNLCTKGHYDGAIRPTLGSTPGQISWTCSGSVSCVATRIAAPGGSCGAASNYGTLVGRTYVAGEPFDNSNSNLCVTGHFDGAIAPTLPLTPPQTITWTCSGSSSCTAIRIGAPAGTCGPAGNTFPSLPRIYGQTSIFDNSDSSLCATGHFDGGTRPTLGLTSSQISWTCSGSAFCLAERSVAPSICGNGIVEEGETCDTGIYPYDGKAGFPGPKCLVPLPGQCADGCSFNERCRNVEGICCCTKPTIN